MAQLIDSNEIFYTNFEPKLKNRFILYVDGIPSYLMNKADRPKLESGQVVLPHMNIERYVKGKTKWQAVNMELYDPIVPSGAQIIMEWVRLGHESVTGRDGYSDFYKKDITINALGPVGDVVEEWTLKGAWPMSVDFNDLDWASEADYNMISISVSYDYAILQF